MENYNKYERKTDNNRNIKYEYYFLNNKYHRLDGPAIIEYYESGQLHRQAYYIKDQLHRIDGPAIVYYFEDGSMQLEDYWFKNNCIQMNQSVELMRRSINKTETLINILNNYKEQKTVFAEILCNMFQKDIDSNVLNNIEMFL